MSQDSNPDDPDSIPDLVDHDHMHVVDEFSSQNLEPGAGASNSDDIIEIEDSDTASGTIADDEIIAPAATAPDSQNDGENEN